MVGLLGGLLLLLLLLLGLSLVLLSRGSFLNGGRCLLLLLLFLLGHKESKHFLCLNHVVFINVKLTEDVINFILGHLDTHLALNVVVLEGLDDEVIRVVAFSGHLLLEHLDHVVIGARSTDLTKKAIKLTLRHEDTNIVKSSSQVILVNDTILVDVHHLEAVLVHVKLLLGETSLILSLSH